MNLVNLIELNILGDSRGSLVALEENKNVPFKIKRVYYIFNTKADVARGFHAHKALKQIAVCVRKLQDASGREKAEVVLDSPRKGLVIDSMVWREMHGFSHDCVLLVLASELYEEADYIRDYEQFLKVVGA